MKDDSRRQIETISDGKRKLELELHDLIKEEEKSIRQSSNKEDRRSACIGILEGVASFLSSWSELSDDTTKLPRLFLYQTISKIIRILGPGNSLLRENLLDIIQSEISEECRQIILDFLPATILPRSDQDEKVELLETLSNIYDTHGKAVAPVLDCLNSICRSGGLSQRDVFKFALQKLPSEHESRIHFVIKCLLENIENEVNARMVIEATRIEMQSTEETGSPESYIAPTCKLLVEFWNKAESKIFVETYLSYLEELVKSKSKQERLLVLDMFVILLSLDNPGHERRVEKILDAALLGLHLKPREKALFLNKGIWNSMPKELMKSLISLAIAFVKLSTRVHDENVIPTEETVREFIMGVFALFDHDANASSQLITSMLHLTDEVTKTDKTDRSFQLLSIQVFKILREVSVQTPHILAPFKANILKKITETPSIYDYSDDAHHNMCALVCNLDAVGLEEYAFEVSDTFLALRTMLFSPNPSYPSNPGTDVSRCVLGFILASEMISCFHARKESILNIWKMVKSILLPNSKQMIHPKVGLYGLHIVKKLRDDAITSIDSSFDREIFQTVTQVVSNTRLVQYVSEYSDRQRKHVAHAYSEQDEFFTSIAQRKKSRKMIFCFDAFIRDPSSLKPSSWEETNRWVFELLNVYLSIGRRAEQSSRKQKWSPRPWIQAAVEFQVVDPSRLKLMNAQQKKFLDFIHREMSGSDLIRSDNRLSDGKAKELMEVIKTLKTNAVKDEVAKSLYSLSLSLIVSLSMSAAILNNAYEQYQESMKDEVDQATFQEKTESFRLINFQLTKIYDLRERCRLIERALQLINRNSKKRRPGRPSRKESSKSQFERTPEITEALLQLKEISSSYCKTSKFIQSKLLWDVVAESSYDAVLVDMIQRDISGTAPLSTATSAFQMNYVIKMKMSAMNHLSSHLLHLTEIKRRRLPVFIPNDEIEYESTLRPRIARCLRLCSFLSLNLGKVKEKQDVPTHDSLLTLTAAYFRLLSRVSILIIGVPLADSKDHERQTHDVRNLVDLSNMFTSILKSQQPLEEAISYYSKSTDFSLLQQSITAHLERCYNASIAHELVETMTVFAIHLGSRTTAKMTDESWKSFDSKFSSLEVAGNLSAPYSLVEAAQEIKASSGYLSTEAHEIERSFKDPVEKLEGVIKSPAGKTSFLTHAMIRHWGLLALSSRNSPAFDDYFSQLLSNIQAFLSETQGPPNDDSSYDTNKEETSDEDGDYLPPQRRKRHLIQSFPQSQTRGLDSISFSTYFETLLRMAVAASSIFSVGEESSNIDSSHPFDRFENHVELFGSLITLYEEKLDIFPQKTIITVVSASKDMLNACSVQLNECIDWRNAQPVVLVHDVKAGKFDAASIEYLKELFDLVGRHVLGRLQTFCAVIHSLKHTKKRLEYKQRVKSLEKKTLKFKGILQKLYVAHNITATDFRSKSESNGGTPLRKRRRTNEKDSLEMEEASQGEDEEDLESFEVVPMEDEKESLSSEASFDYSSEFEASGQWGESDDDEESQPELKLMSNWR